MPLTTVTVDAQTIRALFNKYYLPAHQKEELRKEIKYSGTPDPTAGQPPGTKSEIWKLYDKNDQCIAVVHVYLMPDGSISASGRPDPKEVIIGSNRYILTKIRP